MFCVKCGRKLENNTKFCDKCGTPINNNQKIIENKDEEKHAISLCWLAYGIPIFGIIIIWILSNIITLEFQFVAFLLIFLNIICLVMLIIINAKYPKYKKVNTFLIVYILLTILAIIILIITFLLLLKSCIEGCQQIG